ncbi:hypothetical protein AGMMS49941_11750 [Deferribacterales bacterium]|nr:hypothetical protein AGMMS49941_11750 [Deferribacterales bacterium]
MPTAITIALLAAIESLLSAVVADGMTGDRHDSNTELFAQGIGNIMSGLFGGIPATGAIARTVTNIKAGGVTSVAGLVHAITLLLFIMLFSGLVEHIPMSAIAGMLMVVSIDMFNYKRFKTFAKAGSAEFSIMLLAFVLTIVIDITVAVEVGVVLAALIFMKKMSDVTTLDDMSEHHKDRADDPNDLMYKTVPNDVGVYEINGPLFFGAADNLIHALESINHMPHVVVLRMRKVPVMDSTGLNALERFWELCRLNRAAFLISGMQEQPYEMLKNNTLFRRIGEKNLLKDIDAALARAKEILNEMK